MNKKLIKLTIKTTVFSVFAFLVAYGSALLEALA